MSDNTALILAEDCAHRRSLASLLAGLGYTVETRDDLPDDMSPVLVVLSLDLAHASPAWLAEPVLAGARECLITARDDDPPRVQAFMDAGASYFFSSAAPKPPSFLSSLASDLLDELEAGDQPASEDTLPVLDQFGQLRGSSRPMRKLFRVLRKVAPVDVGVLITGESGTGKELVARTLHEMGPAPESPYIAVNCAAIPADLFESELFGHEKGAFSGADRRHQGYFERAEGGTLFLDELVEMPPVLQAKLLRVLETGGFRRVGGETELQARVRVIGATNVDPEEAVAQGRLREDLYFRVARFPLHLPPLRERGDDIRGLAQLFLSELNKRNDDRVTLGNAAAARLQAYAWPGNVRELRSVLEHAFILAEGTIEPGHLPELAGAGRPGVDITAGNTVEEVERQLIETTLESCDGDREAAAKQLGISVRTLYNRLRSYRGADRGGAGKRADVAGSAVAAGVDREDGNPGVQGGGAVGNPEEEEPRPVRLR
jgi:DNA-binding NtrC family response regulator